MADFSALKQSIETYIKNNGNKEITGAILQNILLSMVTTMGDGAINDNASDISDIKGDIQNINGDITDINGDITDLNGDLSDEINRAEGAESTLQQAIIAEKNRAEGAETTTVIFSDGKLVFKNAAGTVLYQLSVDSFLSAITTRLNTGALYAGYATPSTTPAALTSQEVFYLATQAGTYTNFHFNGGDDPIVLTKDGIYFIVSGTDDDDWNAEPMLQLDDVPTASSNNAVKSGGVAEELALGAVYDVSAKNPTTGINNDGKWESLSALLSDANLNTIIPTSVRKGGMSIKFVQSSDNKYVQYKLKAATWSCFIPDWVLMVDSPIDVQHDITMHDNSTSSINIEVESGKTYWFGLKKNTTWNGTTPKLFFKTNSPSSYIQIGTYSISDMEQGVNVLYTAPSNGRFEFMTGAQGDIVTVYQEKMPNTIPQLEADIEEIQADIEEIKNNIYADVQYDITMHDNSTSSIDITAESGKTYQFGLKKNTTWNGTTPKLFFKTNSPSSYIQIGTYSISDMEQGVNVLYTAPSNGRFEFMTGAQGDIVTVYQEKEVIPQLEADIEEIQADIEEIQDNIHVDVQYDITMTDGGSTPIDIAVESGKAYQFSLKKNTTWNGTTPQLFIKTSSGYTHIRSYSISDMEQGVNVSYTASADGRLEFRTGAKGDVVTVYREKIPDFSKIDDILPEYFAGKKAVTLGDSHSANRNKWLPTVCSLLGMKYNVLINNQLGVGNTVPIEYDYCLNSLLYQATKLTEVATQDDVDIIFLENVHFESMRSETEDSITDYPYIPNKTIDIGTFNLTEDEEKEYFENNYATILNGIEVSQRDVNVVIRSTVSVKSCTLTFSADNISSGNFVINIDGAELSTRIEQNDTLNTAVTKINSWEFDSYTDWRNVQIGSNKILLIYTGNSTPSNNITYSANGTGISMSVSEITETSKKVYRYFIANDLTKWSILNSWLYVPFGFAYPYRWVKGTIELLQKHFPNADIICLALPDYALSEQSLNQYLSHKIDMTDFHTNTPYAKNVLYGVWNEVSKLYSCKCINVIELCGITPFNYTQYYNYNDVHPKDSGYTKWAKTIVKELK